MMDRLRLNEVANQRAKTLSGGWMRRLSIAMALVSSPKVLFLDEPTLGLDVLARRELWSVIRSLRGGHTFGALPDQVPSSGEGVWADFFGRPAYTMTLPVRVAAQFDAVRIFAWGVRTKNGWRLDAECWDEPLTGDSAEDCRRMNAMIENIIRRMPEQYAWSYNRYKRPRGAPPLAQKA